MKVFLILLTMNAVVVVPEPFTSQEACVAAGKATRVWVKWECVVVP